MPCSALSAVDLRSCAIHCSSNSTTSCRSASIMPASRAASCSQCCTSGRSPWVSTNAGRRLRANGNRTSRTKSIELVVPSMSVTMARISVMGTGLGPSTDSGRWMRGLEKASPASGLLRVRLHAGEAGGDVVAGEVGHPAFLVGEQADGHEVRRLAHVEPVPRAVGHADQVALLAQHVVDLAIQVQGELAGAGDEESHLVLAVGVFAEELLAQGGAVGMVGSEADHVDGLVAGFVHQAVDVAAVGRDHFLLA